jgi:hypothetical protein
MRNWSSLARSSSATDFGVIFSTSLRNAIPDTISPRGCGILDAFMRAAPRFCAALLGATALVLTSCSGSSTKPNAHPSTASEATSTSIVASGSVQMRLVGMPAQTVAVGAPAASGSALSAANRVVGAYLRLAIVDALRTGRPGPRLGTLFSPGAAAQAGRHDGAIVTDAGIGPATTPTMITATLRMTTLVDGNRAVAAVSAAISTKVTVTGPKHRYGVARTGELLLMPTFGTWHIVGYDLTVARTDLATGVTTTTTATTGAKP